MDAVRSVAGALHTAAHGAARVLAKAARKAPPLMWPPEASLPVAGLDFVEAQSIHYSVKSLDGGAEVAEEWLRALQLAQVAFDRLLFDLGEARRNLRFWRARLKAGSHGAFMMLARGPSAFAGDALAALGLRPVGAAASDQIESRIVALQVLSAQLAEAVARVLHAAEPLRLRQEGGGGSGSGAEGSDTQLLQAARQAVGESLQRLRAAVAAVAPEAAALGEEFAASLRVRNAALSQTFSGSVRRTGAAAAAGPAAAVAGAEAAAQELGGVLGVRVDKPPRDTRTALRYASLTAARRGGLVGVPPWARMPSRYQRHWLKYAAAAGASGYALLFLYRHSALAGSDDLRRWGREGTEALGAAWQAHLVEPVVALRDELFKTFRDRPAIVSAAEFQADRDSLLRMLEDFAHDRPRSAARAGVPANATATAAAPAPASASPPAAGPSGSGGGAAAAAGGAAGGAAEGGGVSAADSVGSGMAAVMAVYEAELKSPLRNLMAGDLARTLLIQVQRLKVDTEAAMLELDQILRSNELTVSLMAAVPALLVSGFILSRLYRLLFQRAQPNPKTEAVPCRLAMVQLGRALSAQAAAAAALTAAPAADPAARQRLLEAEGTAALQLWHVLKEAERVFRLRDATSRLSEWPHIQADLLQLALPGLPPSQKLELHRSMLRDYALLAA